MKYLRRNSCFKIQSEEGFPRMPWPSCSFSVTKNSSNDVIAHVQIYNEDSRAEQGGGRAASRERTEFKIHQNII